MGRTLRQERAGRRERRDVAYPQVIHRFTRPRRTRSPRVALCVACLPLASDVPVIPGASTRENVDPRRCARQRQVHLGCGPTWG